MRIPVVARSLATLSEMANPQAVKGGQSEALRWTFYDTQTYVAAGSATLNYFTATNPDRTLSNMPTGGQIPAPQFFEIYYFSIDVILPPAAAAVPTQWNDMFAMTWGGRPIFEFEISNKIYGPFPLSFFHASGGIQGFGFNSAAVAATAQQFANNGLQDGGYCVDGAVVIPPVTGFNVRLNWGAPAAVLDDTLVRVNMDGVLHRRVL